MKTTKYLLAISIYLMAISLQAQSNSEVFSFFKKRFSNMNEYEFLFLEKELVEYCKDSIGMKNFVKIINDRKKWFKKYKDEEVKEYKVLFSILNARVQTIGVNDKRGVDSKTFIENQLKEFKVDFPIDDNLLLKLFDYKNRDIATMEECDVATSNFIFFVNDPMQYVRFFKKYKLADYNINKRAHFIGCILEDYNVPVQIRKRIQIELLNLIQKYKDPSITKIYNDINDCSISGNND